MRTSALPEGITMPVDGTGDSLYEEITVLPIQPRQPLFQHQRCHFSGNFR